MNEYQEEKELNIIKENIGPRELAQYLTAEYGNKAAIYKDGSFVVGQDVGNEINQDDRPLAVVTCPGIDNISHEFWTHGWTEINSETGCFRIIEETDGFEIGQEIDLSTCIEVCCNIGHVIDEVEELKRALKALI